MIRHLWLGSLLLATMGCVAHGQEPNSTASLLGPEEGWDACRLELHDVHGLWGGVAVYLDGRGVCTVQKVDQGQQAERFQLTLPRDQARALFRQAVADDLVGLEIPQRPGVPDEGRPTLRLIGPEKRHELGKWDNDEVERFDRLRNSLAQLATEAADPSWTGPYDPAWHPVEGAEISVLIYSGRPDPSWNLRLDELEPVLDKLKDLAGAEPIKRPGLGFRGFRIRFRAGGPGANVEVFRGTILIQQRDGSSETFTDAHGLESWLREQAAARGVELPK